MKTLNHMWGAVAIAVLSLVLFLWTVGAFAATPVKPKLEHYLAECNNGWLNVPIAFGTMGERRRKTVGTKRGSIVVRDSVTKTSHALAFQEIGSKSGGWTWYSVRSTAEMRAAMLADPLCRISESWSSAWATLPAADRDWVKARSTCVGEATKGSATVGAWPCGAPGYVSVREDGFGPKVLSGGTIYEASGVALPQCSDGVDNDTDGNADYPADTQCGSPYDADEGS